MSIPCMHIKQITLPVLVSLVLFCPVKATAQLESATWEESLRWSAGPDSGVEYGQDSAVPEVMTISGNDTGWSADAAISFPDTGPPRAKVDADIWHSTDAIEIVTASGRIDIMFGFEIVQTNDPGVTVLTIPVLGQAEGSVSVSPNGGGGMGHVIFDLVSTEHLGVAFAEISQFSESGPVYEHFLYIFRANAILTEVFHVGLTAECEAYSASPIVGDIAEVSAEVMIPAFVIEDTIIPGTSNSRFPDYFEIVYGDGYYSLGTPTSEEKMSWGSVKALYR